MKTIQVWHDGNKLDIELAELEGEMIESQKKYHAQRIADRILDICDRRGYGLGEVGYYFNEEYIDLMESGLATQKEALQIRNQAEELAELAANNSMRIDFSYNSRFETERITK